MTSAPLPEDEVDRLDALRRLLILDSGPEERYDRIVQFATEEFEVPIALISLVDSNRVWFKARRGMAACESSRDSAFCSHTILENRALVVIDALLDARFHDNPLVTGGPKIRFYAGVPLRSQGHNVGTLCVLDARVRQFDAVDVGILKGLAELVTHEFGQTAPETPS